MVACAYAAQTSPEPSLGTKFLTAWRSRVAIPPLLDPKMWRATLRRPHSRTPLPYDVLNSTALIATAWHGY
jgi:hypothetical protein